MNIAICFNNKDPKPWKDVLQKKLPNVEIEIYPNIKDYHKITFALCWKADKNTFEKFKNLQVAQSVGASVDHIIKEQLIHDGISVSRIVDNHLSEDMFEYILTGILMHLRNFNDYNKNQRASNWHQKPYKTINNTSIGILGTGKIGAFVSKKLSEMGFKVATWSKTNKHIENVNCFFGNDSLNKVLQNDIVINILPLTSETENILNYNNLLQINKNGFFINVGRGEHLVDNDLTTILKNGHLSGALLDVFRTEPLPKEHPFWGNEKIKITPHIAALTNIESAAETIVTNYKNHLTGNDLINAVSVNRGY